MASLGYAQGITENFAVGIETAVVPEMLEYVYQFFCRTRHSFMSLL